MKNDLSSPQFWARLSRPSEPFLKKCAQIQQKAGHRLQSKLKELLHLSLELTCHPITCHPWASIERSLSPFSPFVELEFDIPTPGALVAQSSLCFSGIEMLLGGKKGSSSDITSPLKRALGLKFFQILAASFEEAWGDLLLKPCQLGYFDWHLSSFSKSLELQLWIKISWDVVMSEETASLSLLLPRNLFLNWPDPLETTMEKAEVPPIFYQIPLTLKGILGTQYLNEEELLDLQPGDIILLDQSSSSPLLINCGDTFIMDGWPGLINQNKGLKLELPTK